MKSVQTPPWHGKFGNLKVVWGFIRAGMNIGKNVKYYKKRAADDFSRSRCAAL